MCCAEPRLRRSGENPDATARISSARASRSALMIWSASCSDSAPLTWETSFFTCGGRQLRLGRERSSAR